MFILLQIQCQIFQKVWLNLEDQVNTQLKQAIEVTIRLLNLVSVITELIH